MHSLANLTRALIIGLITIFQLRPILAQESPNTSTTTSNSLASISLAIDDAINNELRKSGVNRAPAANDATFIRRVMLDLIGRIPTLQESQSFCRSADSQKRQHLIDQLLYSPRFALHQADTLDAMLMHGTGGSISDYLVTSLRENRRWDQIFRDVLLGEPGDSKHQGAIQFVKRRANDLDRLTNDTSVLFFGVNVSCAQCHDHPLVPEWSQHHFYGMKSFFSRTFVAGEFVGERAYGRDKFKTSKGEERAADLMFLTGTQVAEPESAEPDDVQKKAEKARLEEFKKNNQPPPPPEFSRRAQLVKTALEPDHSHYFARAFVNHLWARFLGRGLVDPIDQMHPENRPSHPELLTRLAKDFAESSYDIRRLIQGMVSSQAYARSSEWHESNRPDPTLFAVANARPLSPKQYAMQLRIGATNPDRWITTETIAASPNSDATGDAGTGTALKSESASNPDNTTVIVETPESLMGPIADSARSLADQFVFPQDDFQVGIAEALFLSNNPRIEQELVADNSNSLVGKLKKIENDIELIHVATWNVLCRPPQPDEVQMLTEFLQTQSLRDAACRHLVWALLASSECRFNH